jgi:hypothetical protein
MSFCRYQSQSTNCPTAELLHLAPSTNIAGEHLEFHWKFPGLPSQGPLQVSAMQVLVALHRILLTIYARENNIHHS